ncbi:cytochrome c1 [uncultured Rhodoblastus sp.]|uniref:cytochrome c1 n=1 Tax=uncultured Rhodoblastus sp. TaxID=543037 RepID=UPI0025E65D70|nr:cytochrome c1 [uncultured Rhodoblastus sp.]
MAFTRKIGFVAAAVFAAVAIASPVLRAEEPPGFAEAPSPERQNWSFSGFFGTFDKPQLQRGFKVYKEVCSNCHELRIPFRTLGQPGGPGFSEDQVKALAATYTIHDGPNLAGDMFDRPGRASDYFPPPFPNPEAAAAALGAVPPEMSLIAKSIKFERGFPNFVFDALPIPGLGIYQEVGPDLIYAILHGYTKEDDPNWNLYFPGHKIAMAKPLADGQVDYTDGAPTTLSQYSKDVAAFLAWAAEPTLEVRKRVGLRVMLFLFLLAGLVYFAKKRVWSDVAH